MATAIPVIRPAERREYMLLGDLVVDAYRALPGSRMTDRYATWLRRVDVRAAHGEVLVAEVGRQVVGTVTYLPGPCEIAEFDDPDGAEIRALAVAPAAQGEGVGARLVRACLDLAWEAGRHRMWLYTTPWMSSAQHLYERLGFVRVPDRDEWVGDAGEIHLVTFMLDLAAIRAADQRPRTASAGVAMGRAMMGLGDLLEGRQGRQNEVSEYEDAQSGDGPRFDFDPDHPSRSVVTFGPTDGDERPGDEPDGPSGTGSSDVV